MTTMRSMNPDAPGFVDASAAAARYANFVNEPKYEVANKYFESLQKEKEAEKLRAEELRRYNQEFGLKQAEANRQQATYDKENRSDKALVDYQSSLERASAGGAMNDSQQLELGNEFDRLIQNMSEEQAAEIITNKAQSYGSADAKKAAEDPYYRAELLRNVAFSNKDISPEKLITLRNTVINRETDLGDRKEEARLTAEERAYQREMDRKRFSLQQQEYNQRALDKANAKKAIAEFTASSMIEDNNRSSSGAYYNVNQVNTGNKILKDDVLIPENEGSKELSEIDEISNRINSLSSKNISEDGKQIDFENRDEAFKAYLKENPDAANSNTIVKGVDKSLRGASDIAKSTIKSMFLPNEKLGEAFDGSKQIFMSDVEREQYNKELDENRAKEAQEALKSNDKNDKAKSGNISFEDYWSLKKQQQTLDNKEVKKLQTELGEKSVSYSNNLANKYGEDEIKSVPKEMTPHEARIHATKNTVKSLIERGVDEENALKLGIQEGENAFKFQTNYINNVNEDAKEKAKNRYTEAKDLRKELQDEIKTLEKRKFDIGDNKESKIVYNGKTVKLSEVQNSLDDEISRLKKELAELK